MTDQNLDAVPPREKPMTEAECLESVPGAYLSFVRSDSGHLWVIAPSQISRWSRAPGRHGRSKEMWTGRFAWDFGEDVLERKSLHIFLDSLARHRHQGR